MTPAAFSKAMDTLIANVSDRDSLGKAGQRLIEKALGENSFAYVDSIDRWARALRALPENTAVRGPTQYRAGEFGVT